MSMLPLPESAEHRAPGLLLPTNRWNLLAFLTSGLVTPREGLEKYYSDLLESCPGRLPLLTGPCPDGLSELLAREDPVTAFPVLLEFDSATRIDESAPAAYGAVAPAVVLDVAQIAAVHFRSEAELEEHHLRGQDFANMPTDEVSLRVSPALFGGGSASLAELTTWLRSLPRPRLADADFRAADRQSGALVAALNSAPGDSALLSAIVGLLRTPAASSSGAPWMSTWWMGKQRGRAGSPNDRVFRAMCDAIWSSTTSSWRSSEAINQVRASAKLTGDVRRTYDIAFERLQEVLANKRDLDPLSQRPGREVLQALVLFLLRPDPVRIARWEGHGAVPTVLSTAMFMAGLLAGRRSLPSDMRPLPLDQLARSIEIAWLLGAQAPTLTVDSSSPDVIRLVDDNGKVVLECERGIPKLAELVESQSDSLDDELLLALCREQGWDDLVAATTDVAGVGVQLESLPSRRLRLTVSGFPSWTFAVDRVRFKGRLEGIDPTSESEAMKALRASLVR